MKKIIFLLMLLGSFFISGNTMAQRGRSHSGSSSGHYKNGQGSSHKGGSYKRASTNDHYRSRRH